MKKYRTYYVWLAEVYPWLEELGLLFDDEEFELSSFQTALILGLFVNRATGLEVVIDYSDVVERKGA